MKNRNRCCFFWSHQKQIQTGITNRWYKDIQLYKSHVADFETCFVRDSRENNRGREKYTNVGIFLTSTGIPFEILQAGMISQKIPINWIELAHDDRSKNTWLISFLTQVQMKSQRILLRRFMCYSCTEEEAERDFLQQFWGHYCQGHTQRWCQYHEYIITWTQCVLETVERRICANRSPQISL